MTSNRDPLGHFESELLTELKTVVAERSAEQPAAGEPAAGAVRRPLWRRPSIVSVAAAGALAIGAAVGLPLLGGETAAPPASAAFRLTTNDDGTITVTIYTFDDAEGLEAQLEAHGVPADVTYTPWHKRCQPDRFEYAPEQHQVGVTYGIDRIGVREDELNDVELSFTLRPTDFGPDETLVIVNDFQARLVKDPQTGITDLRLNYQRVATAVGPVAPCVLQDDPNDLPLPGGNR
jgi:hypothetical protein